VVRKSGLRLGAPRGQAHSASLNAPDPAKSVPHISIVGLPFANLSNGPSQDYFTEGIKRLTIDSD